jgi:hypothetical protein
MTGPLLKNRSYRLLRQTINHIGRRSAPRGLPIRELLGEVAWFYAGEIVGRTKVNPRLGFTEGLMLVAGLRDVKWIHAAAPNVDLSLYGEFAFYGPKGFSQYDGVLAELRRDPDSRRAVVVLATPADLVRSGLPCTLALQFFIRDGRLSLLAHMRSSDAVLGVPYDVMQFGLLAQCFAQVLGVPSHAVGLSMGSSHEYIDERSKTLQSMSESRYFALGNRVPRNWDGIVTWAGNRLYLQEDWLPRGVPDGIEIVEGPGA